MYIWLTFALIGLTVTVIVLTFEFVTLRINDCEAESEQLIEKTQIHFAAG